MKAKFISYKELISSIDKEIQKQNAELEWYKFKVQQIATRISNSA